MPFDLAGARSAGYSDDEIAGFLASESRFDVEGARRAGYTSTEVIGYLADRAGPAQPPEPEQPLGDPMGSGAPEIMAVSKPKRRSVLEGQVLEDRPFDPARAERLSNRDYAERTPDAYDPRQTAPHIGPARPMTPMVSGERTAGEFAGDTAAAVLKIGPTALKTLAQLYSMGTGGAIGPGAEKQLDIGTAAIDKAFGSQASAQERRELSAILRNPEEGTDALLSFLAGHPMLMADIGITTVGSMFVPAGAVGIAGKVARVPLQARTAQAISQAVNDAMNASQTFSETQGDTGDKYLAAAIAAIGSRGAGKLTGGGMEGQVARSMAGQKLEAAGLVQGAKAVGKEIGKESVQEYGENFSQQVGQDIGEGRVPDLAAANKQGVLGAAVAPIATGPLSVANLAKPTQAGVGAPAVPDPIETIRQAPTVDAAIEAASVAVTAPPAPGATAVDNIARILGKEIADAGQATAVSAVPAEATGSGSADTAASVAVGMGAPAAGVAAVESGSSQPGPAAGPVPLEPGQPAAVAPAEPAAPAVPAAPAIAGPQLTVNPTGTVTITGDAGAIERLLRAHGVTKMLPATNGVLVGKTDAETAQRAMAPFLRSATPEAAATVPQPAQEQPSSPVGVAPQIEEATSPTSELTPEAHQPASTVTSAVQEQPPAPATEVAAQPAGPEPVGVWFGRAGDGYATKQAALNALPARQRAQPDLMWQAEALPTGKFRLAGYAAEEAVPAEAPAQPEPQGRSYRDMSPEEQAAYDERQGIPPGRREEVAKKLAAMEDQKILSRGAAAQYGLKRFQAVMAPEEVTEQDRLAAIQAAEKLQATKAQRDDFTLTGSDRSADANQAQRDLTDSTAPAAKSSSPSQSKPAADHSSQRQLVELRKRKSVLESLLRCLG